MGNKVRAVKAVRIGDDDDDDDDGMIPVCFVWWVSRRLQCTYELARRGRDTYAEASLNSPIGRSNRAVK